MLSGGLMLKFFQKKSLFITFSIMIAVQLCAAFPSVINLEKTEKAEVRNERKEKIIFEKNFGPKYRQTRLFFNQQRHHKYGNMGVRLSDAIKKRLVGIAKMLNIRRIMVVVVNKR